MESSSTEGAGAAATSVANTTATGDSSNSNSNNNGDLQCLVLFQPESMVPQPPQAILQPFTHDDNALLVSLDHSAITSKNPDDPVPNTCRLEFRPKIDDPDQLRITEVSVDFENESILIWAGTLGEITRRL